METMETTEANTFKYVSKFTNEELGLTTDNIVESIPSFNELGAIKIETLKKIDEINLSTDLKFLSQFILENDENIYRATMNRIEVLRKELLKEEIKCSLMQIVYDCSKFEFDKGRDALTVAIDFMDLIERYQLDKLSVRFDFIKKDWDIDYNSKLIKSTKNNNEQKNGSSAGLVKTIIFKDDKILIEFVGKSFKKSLDYISNLMNCGDVDKLCYCSLHRQTSNIIDRDSKTPTLVNWNGSDWKPQEFFEKFLNLMKSYNIDVTYYYDNGKHWNSTCRVI